MGKKLEKCTSYKYLGIFLDEKLNWKVHIKYLCEKLSKLCGIFSKLRHCCSTELMKVIYHALFSSHLQYCNFMLGNAVDRVLLLYWGIVVVVLLLYCIVVVLSIEAISLITR